ncbi:MAG: HAD-IA family hydrolase [Anaerolineales bacterium]|nr:HAD-IA family hydrolase [Anaerolineales bacterium]
MSLILLLDLDDTLLQNDIDSFLPHYLSAFSKEVAPYIEPDRFVRALLAGTRKMVENRRPDCTLKEVFEASFFSALDLDVEGFKAIAERFYAQIFPTLRGLTQPRPEAVQLIEDAQARGYRLVVATNPLFPMTAILQRLDWANLPAEKYAFELITSYESFHFVKPEPGYFAEILAHLGWPSEPAVMVGDDLERDISASRRLGLPAFWLERDGVDSGAGRLAPTASGGLADILAWLDSAPAKSLQPDYTSPSAMLAILRATPAALDSLCRDLQEPYWITRPQPNEWSLAEILCHLRDVDLEVNLPRVRKVLGTDNPFLTGEDTDRWAAERRYAHQDGAQALVQFIAVRLKLLESLETLEPQDWERTARHAIFGPTRLAELVNIIASHDKLHIQQVHQTLAEISPEA